MAGEIQSSSAHSLSEADIHNWKKNLKIFVGTIGIIYIGQIIAIESLTHHVVALNDFIPSLIVVGSIVKYILDSALDLFRKWAAGN